MMVVVEFGAAQPLGWENSTDGTSQGVPSPKVDEWFTAPDWGLVDSKVCSGIVSVAEVDKRHVAHVAPTNHRVSSGSSEHCS